MKIASVASAVCATQVGLGSTGHESNQIRREAYDRYLRLSFISGGLTERHFLVGVVLAMSDDTVWQSARLRREEVPMLARRMVQALNVLFYDLKVQTLVREMCTSANISSLAVLACSRPCQTMLLEREIWYAA